MANDKNIFEAPEKYLKEKEKEIGNLLKRVDYKNLIDEREVQLIELQKKSEEAYVTGNIILGDQLTTEKNSLKESIEALKRINPQRAKEEIAHKYSEISHEFYRLVIQAYMEEEIKNNKIASELLQELLKVTSRADEMRSVSQSLLNTWQNNVIPFDKGENIIVNSDLSFLNNELKRGVWERVRTGNGRTNL